MNLFLSDIAIGDARSSFQMINPLLENIQNEYEGITVLSPKILDAKQSYISHKYFMPFYKSQWLFLRLVSEATLSIIPFVYYLLKVKNKQNIKNIIVYSPSIFLVFFVMIHRIFFKKNDNRYFLILRDLFPIWANDTGLIKNVIVYKVLKFISSLQFRIFDVVGVQDCAAIETIKRNYKVTSKIIVLPNWAAKPNFRQDQIDLEDGLRKILLNNDKYVIYAGMFGEAQNLVPCIKGFQNYVNKNPQLKHKLLIIGNGRDSKVLKKIAVSSDNKIIFSDPIPESLCDILIRHSVGGIVSLSREHHTNNIPGKFIKYLSLGIPVMANINISNKELSRQIVDNSLGVVSFTDDVREIEKIWDRFLKLKYKNTALIEFFEKNYSFKRCAKPLLDWILN